MRLWQWFLVSYASFADYSEIQIFQKVMPESSMSSDWLVKILKIAVICERSIQPISLYYTPSPLLIWRLNKGGHIIKRVLGPNFESRFRPIWSTFPLVRTSYLNVLRKPRRRREIFWDFACKIIDFTKKIDQIHVQNPQNFLGAFGAEVLNKGGHIIKGGTY